MGEDDFCLTLLKDVIVTDNLIQLTHNLSFFAAFKCWCQASWQYSIDFPSHFPQDGDVM